MAQKHTFWDDLKSRIADEALFSASLIRGGDVLCPESTEQVQEIVRMANRHKVSIQVHKSGAADHRPHDAAITDRPRVIMDIGMRMNRILNIDTILGYCVLEPGVTFKQLFDELERAGCPFMISVPEDPNCNSVLESAIERRDGISAYSDHFGACCGMEIVLGNGAIVRTGDGALNVETCPSWHLSKYSFGPNLDTIFTQSTFGLVTRIGVWLMPRPAAILPFVFKFPGDKLGDVVESVRQLKLYNHITTPIRLMNEEFLLAGTKSLSKSELDLVGAWNLSGGIYALTNEGAERALNQLKECFSLLDGHCLSLKAIQSSAVWKVNVDALIGMPSDRTSTCQHRAIWFDPVLPMLRGAVDEMLRSSQDICARFGLELMVSMHCGPRAMRMRHCLSYQASSPDAEKSARECHLELMRTYINSGYSIVDAPSELGAVNNSHLKTPHRELLNRIKSQLDPNNVISP